MKRVLRAIGAVLTWTAFAGLCVGWCLWAYHWVTEGSWVL